MATMQRNKKVRSGNWIIPTLAGVRLGLIQSVRMSDDYSPEPASGIGDIHIAEYVPSVARHSIQVSQMVLENGSLRQAGIAMENGDSVLEGLVFDIEVQDKATGQTLRKYVGCSYASGDVDVQAHRIVVANAQFNALNVIGTEI